MHPVGGGRTVSRRRVWLLDVDGVINASRPGWSERPHRAEITANGQPWRMRWSPSMVRAIREIALSGEVDVVWATTWCPWADQLEAMFGLPRLPLAFSADALAAKPAPELKVRVALAEVERGSLLIWTDDDAIPISGEERRKLDDSGALLISPASNRGLQPPDLDRVRSQLRDWRTRD